MQLISMREVVKTHFAQLKVQEKVLDRIQIIAIQATLKLIQQSMKEAKNIYYKEKIK